MTQFKWMDGIMQLRLDVQSGGQQTMWSERLWSCTTTIATEIDSWVDRTGVHTRLVGWRGSLPPNQWWLHACSVIQSCPTWSVAQSCLTLCDPMDCSPPGSSVHGNFPGKSAGVGCHFLLQEIFLTQGSNPGLPNCRQVLYCLSHQGNQSSHKCWV